MKNSSVKVTPKSKNVVEQKRRNVQRKKTSETNFQPKKILFLHKETTNSFKLRSSAIKHLFSWEYTDNFL